MSGIGYLGFVHVRVPPVCLIQLYHWYLHVEVLHSHVWANPKLRYEMFGLKHRKQPIFRGLNYLG